MARQAVVGGDHPVHPTAVRVEHPGESDLALGHVPLVDGVALRQFQRPVVVQGA
jgi:hypothetical protein